MNITYAVIERHELHGNQRVWTGFTTIRLAADFSEQMGDENKDDNMHYDVLPVSACKNVIVPIQTHRMNLKSI